MAFSKKNSYDFFLIRESRMTCFSKVQNLDQKSLQLRCWQLTSIFHKLRHLVLPPPLEFAQINRNSLHNVEGYFCGGFTTVDALLKNGKIFSEISLSGTRHELSCFFFTRIFHQKNVLQKMLLRSFNNITNLQNETKGSFSLLKIRSNPWLHMTSITFPSRARYVPMW